jgi:molybdopterin molybdotransferase
MADLDVTQLLSVTQAIDLIDRFGVVPRQMVASSLEQVPGHVLQQEVVADRDYPPLDKSQIDGYAVRSKDIDQPGCELRLVGSILAGQSLSKSLKEGECVRINTGAAVPPGADVCVPIEKTQALLGDRVKFLEPMVAGRYISTKASECVAGKTVLLPGTRLGPAQLAMCAQFGVSRPLVAMKPRVGVLTTGDEIVPYYEVPPPTQLRNSNAILLGGLLLKLDCTVKRFEHAPDDRNTLRATIRRMLDSAELDVLFITGGMSMGERDHVSSVLGELRFETHIDKLRIKPGKPFVFASRMHRSGGVDHQQFVFGLPGNPVSGYVCTLVLAARLLTRLSGATPTVDVRKVTLQRDIPANGPRQFYQPAIVSNEQVQPLNWVGSADIATLSKANALIVRQEDAPAIQSGSLVDVLMLP